MVYTVTIWPHNSCRRRVNTCILLPFGPTIPVFRPLERLEHAPTMRSIVIVKGVILKEVIGY